MPLYEYQCTQCSERVEVIQRLSDPPYAHCPKCGGDMKKLLSAPAIQFKGSGWYKTDYASKPSAKSGDKSGEKSEGKSESKSDTSDSRPASESKTESKTESKPKAD
jgi:putative FmdB family regulatory protein